MARTLLKAGAILAGLVVFVVVALAVMGSSAWLYPTYKNGIAGAITQATGYETGIEELTHFALFPNIVVGVRGVTMAAPGAGEGADPVASVEGAELTVGLLDALTGNATPKALEVTGLRAQAGAFTPRPLRIDATLVADEAAPGQGALQVRGRYGTHPVSIDVGMAVTGPSTDPRFGPINPAPVHLVIGGAKGQGPAEVDLRTAVETGLGAKITLRDVALKARGKTVGTSERCTLTPGDRRLSTSGTFALGESVISRDITLDWGGDRPSVKGSVDSPRLRVADLQPLIALATRAGEIWNGPGGAPAPKPVEQGSADPDAPVSDFAALKSVDADVKIAIDALDTGALQVENLRTHVKLNNGNLDAPFSASVTGGAIKGRAALVARESPARLALEAELTDWNYAAALNAQEHVNGGEAQARVSLTGAGDSVAAIKRALAGEIFVLAGPAELGKAIPGSWAAGFVRAALPSFNKKEELHLNCAVGDFAVDGGVASARTLFLDGAHVTLVGTGTYDIARDRLNLEVSPHAKDVTLGDLAPAVDITGPIARPSFRADMKGAALKLSSIAIGTMVNPAIGAALLADVGQLSDNRCEAYLNKTTQQQ